MSTLALKQNAPVSSPLIDVGCVLCGSKHSKRLKEKLGYWVTRCLDCELIFINPRPSAESLQELYYDPESNLYNGEFAQNLELETPTLNKIISRLKQILKKGKVFEVGCGNADLLKLAQKEGYEVEGCDLVDQTAARQSAPFKVYERPLRELQLKPSQFDAILVRNTFEHYFSPHAELEEIHRILKPGGFLYLKVPNVQFEQGLLCRLAFQVADLFAPPRHLNHFSPKTLKAFLGKSGFDFHSWQVEIPSKMQGTIKNLLRKIAYVLCLFAVKIPSQPLGSGVTLACVAQKRK